MNPTQLINQDSGNVEYYTPLFIIDAARQAMGGVISLDPFSNEKANQRVGALRYYGIESDGFTQEWVTTTLWMNHPFSTTNNPRAITKIELEYESGRMKQGCCITFAATSEKWFQPLLRRPQCFLSPRTNYHLPDGTMTKGVGKGSVVTYYGTNVGAFAREFAALGVVKIPFTYAI